MAVRTKKGGKPQLMGLQSSDFIASSRTEFIDFLVDGVFHKVIGTLVDVLHLLIDVLRAGMPDILRQRLWKKLQVTGA